MRLLLIPDEALELVFQIPEARLPRFIDWRGSSRQRRFAKLLVDSQLEELAGLAAGGKLTA